MKQEYVDVQLQFFRRRIASYKSRIKKLRRRRRIILWFGLPPGIVLSVLSAFTTLKVIKEDSKQAIGENMAAIGDLLPDISTNVPMFFLSLVIIIALLFSLLLQIREDEIEIAKHGIGKCKIIHLLSGKEQKELMIEINEDKHSLIRNRNNLNLNILEIIKSFVR